MRPLDERSHAFVVKIWEERRDLEGGPPLWRGSVEDVRDGTRRYFGTFPELCAFLGQHSGMAIPARRWPAELFARKRRG